MKSGHDWFKYCDALWDHPSGNKWQFFWLLEQLINCKIPSSAIHLSLTVKCLLLLSTTHSQLLMANPKLLGTDNTIPGKKPRSRNIGYVEDQSQTCPKPEWLRQAETIQIYLSTSQEQQSLWLNSVFTWQLSGVSPALLGHCLHTVVPCVQWKGVHLNQEQSGKEVWGTCEGVLDKLCCLQQCTAHTGWQKT